MVCDCVDFEIYTAIQVTHNHDNSIVFEKNLYKIYIFKAHDHIDFKYIHY